MAWVLKTFSTLNESVAILRLKFGQMVQFSKKLHSKNMSPSLRECYHLLDKTGRSYGFLINGIDQQLRNALCIFYLVLRAADTVEDDMSIPSDLKVAMLQSFDQYILDLTWKYTESKDEHAIVLENFPHVSQGFHELPTKYRDVIMDMAIQVSQGMVRFIGREITSMEDLHEYCHLVGARIMINLVRLFVASGLEEENMAKDTVSLSQLSLLLHKTNMIKDFWRDWNNGRLYWPKEIWSKYVSSPGDLLKPENQQMALECLNEFTGHTLEHLPVCTQYLNKLKNGDSRDFLTINTIMALASLERCYNNPDVFNQTVKIRRGETAKIMLSASNTDEVNDIVQDYTLEILKTANRLNSQARTREACLKILDTVKGETSSTRQFFRLPNAVYIVCSAAAATVISFLWW